MCVYIKYGLAIHFQVGRTKRVLPPLCYICSLKHEPFMLATSKSRSDSEGFELYITTTAIPHLDDKLLVFGRVVRGADVVQVFLSFQ